MGIRRPSRAGRGPRRAAESGELERLARRYAHRVDLFADRVGRRWGIEACWRDDLVSAGGWGLFQALRNRRDDAQEAELSAYVSQRIQGAVLDAARACLRHRARAGASVDADGEDELSAEDFRCAAEDPERAAARRRGSRRLARALAPLGGAERRLLLAFAEGDSLAEIARREGVAPATLHQRWARTARGLRARTVGLRAALEEEGDDS